MNETLQCPHFPLCGGCQFLDLTEREERAQKEQLFTQALNAQGLEADIADYRPSPLYSRRRARFSAKRTKKSAMLGFTEARTHSIVDMQACLILEPSILALKPALLEMTKLLASRSSTLKLHVTKLAHGFDVEIENAKDVSAEILERLARISAEHAIHRVTLAGEIVFSDAPAEVEIGGLMIAIPPHPFLQATKSAEADLRALAHEAVAGAKRVADLFAGLGTFSYGLNAEVDAFEGAAELSAMMQKNVHQHGLHNIHPATRDLFREPLSAKELAPYDAVIIDPPRAGAKAQCAELAQSDVPIIAFIACDASSFARDAKCLIEGGYRMSPVGLIDQFRFSNHIESFTVFEKTR